MSLVPVTLSSAYPLTGFSLPDMVSFCVKDADGTGGTLFLDGLGLVNGSDTFDIPTLFANTGISFASIPLMRAFKAVPAATGNASALAQFSKLLDISCYPIVGVASPAVALRFQPITGIMSSPTTPFLMIVAGVNTDPDYAGDTWRLTLKLRHSVTN